MSFADVAEGLREDYRRARHLIPDDWRAASAHDLHELRQRVVVHRYQMEIVEPLWPRLGRSWVREAQKLRNRLGTYQDLAVLCALCRAAPAAGALALAAAIGDQPAAGRSMSRRRGASPAGCLPRGRRRSAGGSRRCGTAWRRAARAARNKPRTQASHRGAPRAMTLGPVAEAPAGGTAASAGYQGLRSRSSIQRQSG